MGTTRHTSGSVYSGAKGERALLHAGQAGAPLLLLTLRRLTSEQRASFRERLIRLFLHIAKPEPSLAAKMTIRVLSAILLTAMAEADETGDLELRRWAAELLYETGRRRSSLWAAEMHLDGNDLRSLTAMQDREDDLFGVSGQWVEYTPWLAIKEETTCPFAALAHRDPSLCREIIHRFEVETFAPHNSNYSLEPLDETILSEGGSRCRFVHRLGR